MRRVLTSDGRVCRKKSFRSCFGEQVSNEARDGNDVMQFFWRTLEVIMRDTNM